MQGYGKQLGLKDLAAIITYERNAWGNNTGDAVQAAAVNEFLTGKLGRRYEHIRYNVAEHSR